MNDTTALTPKTRIREEPRCRRSLAGGPHGGTLRCGRSTSSTIKWPTRQWGHVEGTGGSAESGNDATGTAAAVSEMGTPPKSARANRASVGFADYEDWQREPDIFDGETI
jgi:hypothetical protein